MLYITQLIYIQEGQEAIFDQFEAVAIPIIPKYGGELVLRIRPGDGSKIGGIAEMPYEVHLVSFPDQEAFTRFMLDEERKQFLDLKIRSIARADLIVGNKYVP
jgi:hypothetical protein